MKLALAATLLATTISLTGKADYVPDRTRPTAEAAMDAITGDGEFANARSAQLVELTTDGKGVTQYELTVDGQTIRFAVKKAANGHCGDFYEAHAIDADTQLTLRDMSYAECQVRAKHVWEGQVVKVRNGRASHLLVGGDPEHLVVTQ